MSSKGKYIGLNQRIPFDVLDSAIYDYIEKGVIDKNYILERTREFTVGPNRAKKATAYIAQILTRQTKIINALKTSQINFNYSDVDLKDRKALCLCLISLTYPITYDLLIALAQGFKVQTQINKKFIAEKVMSIYGSNRTVDIAIDALMPIIIEVGTIQRVRTGFYSLANKIKLSNEFIFELIIYTDMICSSTKHITEREIFTRPWYLYFEFNQESKRDNYKLITTHKNSELQNYISIRNSK